MREYGISMVSELDKYELYKMSSSVREPEAVAGKCSIKKVFSKISKNLQQNTCVGAPFLMKLQA